MDAAGDLEKYSIAGHGVTHARAAQHRRIHGAERGNRHGQSDPRSRATADNMLDDVGSDVLRSGYVCERQNLQAGGAE